MLSSPRSNGILHISGRTQVQPLRNACRQILQPWSYALLRTHRLHPCTHRHTLVPQNSHPFPTGNSYGNIHDCRRLLGFSTCIASYPDHLLCVAAIRMGITRPTHWGAVEIRSVHGGWTTMLSTFSTFKKHCSQSLLYIGVHSLPSRRSPSTVRQKSWRKMQWSLISSHPAVSKNAILFPSLQRI